MSHSDEEELTRRVYFCQENILVFHEFPTPTVARVQAVRQRIETLTCSSSSFCFILDVREIKARPGPEVRALAHDMLEAIKPKTLFVAAVTQGGPFQNVLLKFALENTYPERNKICTSLEESIAVCQQHLSVPHRILS